MPMSPQEMCKKYKREILGMPKAFPSSSTKIWGHFQDNIFLLLHMICVILGTSVIFALNLFYFVFCIIWLHPRIFCLERDTLRFHCLEHSTFYFYYSVSVHFWLVLRLALVFHLYFVHRLLVCFSFIWLALWSLLIIIYESCFNYVDWFWRRVKYFMLIVVQ